MMNKAELKVLKGKIDTEIKSTQKKIEKYSLLCKPIAPENSIGRISRMDAINNKSVVESALRVAKEKIQQLIAIQNKIKNSNFGICQKCKIMIPFERLMIKPYSRFCVNCAK